MRFKKISLFFSLIKQRKKIKEKTQQVARMQTALQNFNYVSKLSISVIFARSNSFLILQNNNGVIFNYSFKKSEQQQAKNKNVSSKILKNFLKIILSFLKPNQKLPAIINFYNSNYNCQWFIQKLSKHLFLPIIRFYKSISFNGCRKKKLKTRRNG